MLTKSNRPEPWLEALKFIGQCPICKAKYENDKARLFAKKESANLIHITCGACASNFIAMIVTMGQAISSVGVITDLNFEDAKKIYKTHPVSVDEIIEGYQFIKSNFR